ncbi:MAG: response regulator [Bacteroidetes bacterium]|nr:MAG: response regulator [Bacteroidota bacterium]
MQAGRGKRIPRRRRIGTQYLRSAGQTPGRGDPGSIRSGEGTGFECLEEIRSGGYDMKIIAQTAYAMFEEKKRCMELGCDGYLVKPFSKKALFDSIGTVFKVS